MFCNKCGAYNDDNANSCAVCNESFVEIKEWLDSENAVNSMDECFDVPVVLPKSHFMFSVISAALCSFIFGIAALVFAVMVDVNCDACNFDMAERYSEKAKMFCNISLAVGIVKYVSVLFWFLVMR